MDTMPNVTLAVDAGLLEDSAGTPQKTTPR
jgi:hypothetical protein